MTVSAAYIDSGSVQQIYFRNLPHSSNYCTQKCYYCSDRV